MREYIARRVIYSLITIFAVATILFVMFRMMPGDPTAQVISPALDEASQARLKKAFGLDEPVWMQYLIYLKNVVTLDWGRSFQSSENVFDVLMFRFWNTLLLMAAGMLLTLFIGIFGGMVMGWMRGGKLDLWATVSSMIFQSAPPFITGILLLIVLIGGKLDEVLMRLTDVVYGMPFLPFIIVLIALFGRSKWFVMLAIVLIVWRTSARVVRAQTLSLKQRQFVAAAKVRGCGAVRIIYRHIMPNILPLLLLYTAFNIAWSVIAEAGASFLGFGDPDQLSWGGMLYELWISGKSRVAWWWFALPSIAIVMLVTSLVFISRAYEEVANPRLKQR